jgi:DNA repair photolyase
LKEELSRPGYQCQPIALGVNTDGWQPAERRLQTTRGVLRTLWEHRHPVSLITKAALIERDLDILEPMAKENLVSVMVSITTLDTSLARKLEPRATAPRRRLEIIARLQQSGIPVGVLTAPVIPGLTDCELETILEAAAEAGARTARYILLRLPMEVKPLFEEWLGTHYPEKASRVMKLIRDTRGGRAYDSRFGTRMRGTGVIADLIAQRFALSAKKLGLDRPSQALDCGKFQPPRRVGEQLSLF